MYCNLQSIQRYERSTENRQTITDFLKKTSSLRKKLVVCIAPIMSKDLRFFMK